MIARPVAVEPVNVTRSTSGLVVSTSPTATEDEEMTLTTPGGMSVSVAISSASASVISGVSGAALSTTVQPGREGGGELGQGELGRVVVADDRGDDAGRLLLHPAAVLLAA